MEVLEGTVERVLFFSTAPSGAAENYNSLAKSKGTKQNEQMLAEIYRAISPKTNSERTKDGFVGEPLRGAALVSSTIYAK